MTLTLATSPAFTLSDKYLIAESYGRLTLTADSEGVGLGKSRIELDNTLITDNFEGVESPIVHKGDLVGVIVDPSKVSLSTRYFSNYIKFSVWTGIDSDTTTTTERIFLLGISNQSKTDFVDPFSTVNGETLGRVVINVDALNRKLHAAISAFDDNDGNELIY